MADTYGVVPADIAAELVSLFPVGFTQVTKPTAAQVASFIASADLLATIEVQNVSGATPSASDRVAPLVRDVIINRVKAKVLAIVYAALAPDALADALRPYTDAVTEGMAAILAMETQAAGTGVTPPTRVYTSATPTRDLLVTDDDLGFAPHRGGYTGSTYADRGRY